MSDFKAIAVATGCCLGIGVGTLLFAAGQKWSFQYEIGIALVAGSVSSLIVFVRNLARAARTEFTPERD